MSVAIEKGDIKTVSRLIEQGLDINANPNRYYIPLHQAVVSENKEMVEFLLNQGADINALGYMEETSLQLALKSNHNDILDLLLAKGADLNVKNTKQQTALHLAAIGGHIKTIEWALSHHLDINAQDSDGNTALHLAVANKHLEAVTLLIANGADIGILNQKNLTPGYLAISIKNKPIMEFFMLLKATGKKDMTSSTVKKVLDLYNKLKPNAINSDQPGGFVTGTLIHTQEGLKPIEQIKVGDLVLSKPENEAGKASYQRVTRTFEYEQRPLYFAAWIAANSEDKHLEYDHVVVTGEHPFWIKQMSFLLPDGSEEKHQINEWITLEELRQKDIDAYINQGVSITIYIELTDGREAVLWYFAPIIQAREPEKGIVFSRRIENWDLLGVEINLTKNGPEAKLDDRGFYIENILIEEDAVDYDYNDTDSLITQSMGFLPMRQKVFNLEIEKNSSFCVSKHGIWVNNI